MLNEQLKALCPEFRESIYDFRRLPGDREIFRKLLDYDNRLFLLWSKLHQRWELWRWKQSQEPRPPSGEREIYENAKCQCCFPQGYTPDMRLIANLEGADLWKQAGTDDQDKVTDAIVEELDDQARADRKAVRADCEDIVRDNVRVLRNDMSEMFRGYYPSELNPPEHVKKADERRKQREREEG